ncbi:hypothetical protein [Catellatospora sichuanensis]|uniref:hypothetical protein n=1 Tax=Catellatospora sichuanensis TaxID=1969805 RepID=UPI0011823A5F|nr:hypothetical protein [Catellatospora sichuanensis]
MTKLLLAVAIMAILVDFLTANRMYLLLPFLLGRRADEVGDTLRQVAAFERKAPRNHGAGVTPLIRRLVEAMRGR